MEPRSHGLAPHPTEDENMSFQLVQEACVEQEGAPVTPQGLWARPPGPPAEDRAGVALAAVAGPAVRVLVDAEVPEPGLLPRSRSTASGKGWAGTAQGMGAARQGMGWHPAGNKNHLACVLVP